MYRIGNIIFSHALLETAISSNGVRVFNFMSSLIKSIVDLLQSIHVRLLSVLIKVTVIQFIFFIEYFLLRLLFGLTDLVQYLSNFNWGAFITEVGALTSRHSFSINSFTTSLTLGILRTSLHDYRWNVRWSSIGASPWLLIAFWTANFL